MLKELSILPCMCITSQEIDRNFDDERDETDANIQDNVLEEHIIDVSGAAGTIIMPDSSLIHTHTN